MASFTFHRLKLELFSGSIDWTTDAFALLLLDAALVAGPPDPSADSLDVIVGELVTDNYDRSEILGRVVERDDDLGLSRWLADGASFPELGPEVDGPTIAGAIVFAAPDEEDESTWWPMIYLEDVAGTVNGTTFTVVFDETGLLRLRDA